MAAIRIGVLVTNPLDGTAFILQDIKSELQAMRGDMVKVLTHMEGTDTRNKAADILHTDHESRIRALERWRYSLPVTLFISFASVAIAVISLFRR